MVPVPKCHYFNVINRTAYSLKLVGKHGSDFPIDAAIDGSLVIKSGETSCDTLGIKSAYYTGSSKWGFYYFEVLHAGGITSQPLVFYVHSSSETRFDCQATLPRIEDSKPTGRWNIPGRKIGHVSRTSQNRTWIVLTGGDIMMPLNTNLWMTELFTDWRPEASHWPITALKIPGSHDACTFGSRPHGLAGKFDGSWRCQDFDLFEQLERGIRYFDVRLKPVKDGSFYRFEPFHGPVFPTADPLARSPEDMGGDGTLAAQIARWADSHKTELIFLAFTLQDVQICGDDFVKTIKTHLGSRLATRPVDGRIPSYTELMAQEGRNIILFSPCDFGEYFDWNIFLERDDHDFDRGTLYNDQTWKSGCPRLVVESIEKFVNVHGDLLKEHRKFWVGQLQLTPSLGADIESFKIFIGSPSYSPKRLAPKTKAEMNWRVPDSELIRSAGSFLQCDFADELSTSAIVTMNLLGG